MGKCFEKELDILGNIYEEARKADCKIISDFIKNHSDELFLLVGSGGSYSVAVAAEYMLIRAGMNAKCVTPLELNQYFGQIKKCAVILFSASGRNADSRNAYQYIAGLEPKGILTVCMHINSPMKKMQFENMHNVFFEFAMPVAKDGYLAVESLISSMVIFSKALHEFTGDAFYDNRKYCYRKFIFIEKEKEIFSKETIIVLCGGITKPIAIDLESKFGETSLGNVQVLDFRNFAHGRHFWLEDRGTTTGIIALVDENEKVIADKTLQLLPENIPVFRRNIKSTSVNDLWTAYYDMFEMVNCAAKIRAIDPGKPKVPDFGRKLYHINYKLGINERYLKMKKDPIACATLRKTADNLGDFEYYYELGCQFDKHLCSHRYRGIIFDYDGTLHNKNYISLTESNIFNYINNFLKNGIIIGIATGRGKSIRIELQKKIDPQYWENVVIGYYNGGCIGRLSDNSVPDKKAKEVPEAFEKIASVFENRNFKDICLEGIKDKNPYQLSVINLLSVKHIEKIREALSEIADIKVYSSSHSLDIIPCSSSKTNLLDYYLQEGYRNEDFLRVGDAGQYGGNDYELLNSKFGVSVDLVSQSEDTCWNMAPFGRRNLEAALSFLDRVEISDKKDGFCLRGICK